MILDQFLALHLFFIFSLQAWLAMKQQLWDLKVFFHLLSSACGLPQLLVVHGWFKVHSGQLAALSILKFGTDRGDMSMHELNK